jgi:hypothetical protein
LLLTLLLFFTGVDMTSYRTLLFGTVAFVCAVAPMLPAQADSVGALPKQQDSVGALPKQADSVGALPKQADSVGALPKQADSVGALPKQADSVGALPKQADSVGALPKFLVIPGSELRLNLSWLEHLLISH